MESDGSVDGNLFLIRHLLVLKEITSSLETIQRDPGLSRTAGTGTFGQYMRHARWQSPTRHEARLPEFARQRRFAPKSIVTPWRARRHNNAEKSPSMLVW